MNVIIGMTDMALDGELPAASREYLETVRRATLGLVAIVNDILDCSKIEAGKVTLESEDVPLHTLLDEVIQVLGPHAREKGLTLTSAIDPEVPPYVHADPLRLKQVLTNFIDNALKFTHEGGVTVEVAASDDSASHARIRFAVRDTGIGIPADRQAVIFESFTQGDDSTTRTYGGTGLGLSICRQLVELMGGRIGVESSVGEGSTFWFEVTLARAPDDHAPADRVAASA
jgi:signal transduction histidine kinase